MNTNIRFQTEHFGDIHVRKEIIQNPSHTFISVPDMNDITSNTCQKALSQGVEDL